MALYNVLAGISLGIALLCKSLPALIVVPVWLLVVADSKTFTRKAVLGHLLVMLTFCALTAAPYHVYIRAQFPAESAWEAASQLRHITEVIENHSGEFQFLFK
jgi:hypothetical protein